MANGRSSQDERKLEGGAAAAPPQDNGLHPAFYIAYVLNGDGRWPQGVDQFSLGCGLL